MSAPADIYGLVNAAEVRARFADNYASASEILAESLVRVRIEKSTQADVVRDLREQLTIAIMLHAEAEIAEAALVGLLDGALYEKCDAAVSAILKDGEQVIDADVEPEAEAADDATPVEVGAVAEPESVETEEPPAPALDGALESLAVVAEMNLSVRAQAGAAEAIKAARKYIESKKPPRSRLITGTGTADLQMEAAMTFLRACADEHGVITGKSLGDIAKGANIPQGGTLQALRRAEGIGLLTIEATIRPGTRAPGRNVYRLLPVPDGDKRPHQANEATKAAPAPVALAPPEKPAPRVPDNVPVGLHRSFGKNSPRAVLTGKLLGDPPAGYAPPAVWDERDQEPAALMTDALRAPPTPGKALVTDLRPGVCHWPVSGPTGAAQPYCAKPCASDQQYCPKHRAAMFAPIARKALRMV